MHSPIQDMSNKDFQKEIDSRLKANLEIFESLLSGAVAMVTRIFPTASTVAHDGDKARALEIAKFIYSRSITHADSKELGAQIWHPQVEELPLSSESENGFEHTINSEIGSF